MPRLNRTSSIFYLTVLLAFSWSVPSFAPDTDILPYLKKAIADRANPDVFAFLQKANEGDLEFLKSKIEKPVFFNWERWREYPFQVTRYRETDVVGALGEVYLNTYMRDWVKQHPETEFVEGAEYDKRNPHGSRPDGLVVRRVAGDAIVLEKILESKMDVGYRRSQLLGFLRHAKSQSGFLLPNGTRYVPDKILIPVAGKMIPLSRFDLSREEDVKQIEKNVFLFASKPETSDFAGEVIRTPFLSEELFDTTARFLGYGYLGENASKEKLAELLADSHTMRGRNRMRGRLPRPPVLPVPRLVQPEEDKKTAKGKQVLPVPKTPTQPGMPKFTKTPPRSPETDAELVKFIDDHADFPSHQTSSRLTYYMNSRDVGGRMSVFGTLLTDETREKIFKNGRVPAISPMQNWLATVDPQQNPENAQSVLSIYLRTYAKDKSPAFLESLGRRSRSWSQFLQSHPMDSYMIRTCGQGLSSLNLPAAQ